MLIPERTRRDKTPSRLTALLRSAPVLKSRLSVGLLQVAHQRATFWPQILNDERGRKLSVRGLVSHPRGCRDSRFVCTSRFASYAGITDTGGPGGSESDSEETRTSRFRNHGRHVLASASGGSGQSGLKNGRATQETCCKTTAKIR